MDCTDLREALSARLDGEDPGVDLGHLEAHLAGCPGCTTYAREIGVLHRMTRVRAAEAVPDLSAAIVAAFPGSAHARNPFGERISVARWALFAIALTQLGRCVTRGRGRRAVPDPRATTRASRPS